MSRNKAQISTTQDDLLKPMDIKRLAQVPYQTVLGWLTTGHLRAGILPSIDLAAPSKRHSYRIRMEDWKAFLARLQTVPRERQQKVKPLPRPGNVPSARLLTFSETQAAGAR